MTAQEALDIAREIVADGEYTTLTQTGTNAVVTLADEVERLRAAIDFAAAVLKDARDESETIASHSVLDLAVGRAIKVLTKAVSL